MQGFTEWLPISSSAHIFLVETYFGLTPSIELAAWLHGGSFLAVLVFYRKRIGDICKGLLIALRERRFSFFSVEEGRDTDNALVFKIILATFISAPIIILLERSGMLHALTLQTVALTLGITGFLILVSEYLPKKSREISWLILIFFGLAQALAVFPGISRAGITIALLLALGVRRREAVDFSFLAAIPMLFGALGFASIEIGPAVLSLTNITLWLGLLVSFATSLAGIYYMRKWIESKWVWFAPYCFALAGLLILL